ncbi:interleukin-5 receptor subunit alpha-like isoform X2 [Protopterus annectens]|uniref:interleukin-5 receptor subunit alpha-like isoform X2 n=1 Tax=Protopterus annectens TaxID=7888 RepID=UPI001CFAF58D|nr:interleukin-5 receptor subunit alpha-like isoform X2 [Protopterus annectens]
MHISMVYLHLVFPFTCWQLMFIYIYCANGIQSMYVKPPVDITVKGTDCEKFNVSWNSNLTEDEIGNYTVKYVYRDDAFDEDELFLLERQSWRQTSVFSFAEVQTVLCNDTHTIAKSEWVKFNLSTGSTTIFLEDISCVIFDERNLNCTWITSKKAQNDSQYFFSACTQGKKLTCEHYWKTLHHQHTGCHIQNNNKIAELVYACVHVLSGQSLSAIECKQFEPYKIEKLNPPKNLFVDEEMKLKWGPPNTSIKNMDCFIYQLNESALLRKMWKVIDNDRSTIYQPAVNIKTEKYSYQVRVKKSQLCLENEIWSDWSSPVFIGEDIDEKIRSTRNYILLSMVFLLSLCAAALCVRFHLANKLFYILLPPIPSPSNKVKSILMLEEVGFQKFMNAPVKKVEEVVIADFLKEEEMK